MAAAVAAVVTSVMVGVGEAMAAVGGVTPMVVTVWAIQATPGAMEEGLGMLGKLSIPCSRTWRPMALDDPHTTIGSRLDTAVATGREEGAVVEERPGSAMEASLALG